MSYYGEQPPRTYGTAILAGIAVACLILMYWMEWAATVHRWSDQRLAGLIGAKHSYTQAMASAPSAAYVVRKISLAESRGTVTCEILTTDPKSGKIRSTAPGVTFEVSTSGDCPRHKSGCIAV